LSQLVSHEGATPLERAIRWGMKYGVLDADEMERLRRDAPKGIRQISAYISTAHLRTELEHGFAVMLGLVNLALNSLAPGDPQKAAKLLRDRGILALSREGNGRIKALRALPSDTFFETRDGSTADATPEKAFLEEWALKPFAPYQNERVRREGNQAQTDAAKWMVARVNGALDDVVGYHADLAGRTALLAFAAKLRWPRGSAEFEQLLGKLAARKSLSAPADVAEELAPILSLWAQECAKNVLPLIKQAGRRHELSSSHPDNPLTAWLLIPDVDLGDVDSSGASTSNRWNAVTEGRSDETTLLSIMLTVALDAPPRSFLSAEQFKKVVQEMKSGVLDIDRVRVFIDLEVPHPNQEALHQLWQDFRDEAENCLVDGAESLSKWLNQEVRVGPTKSTKPTKRKKSPSLGPS